MIDLHTHSTCSDGTSTPVELLKQAAQAAIRALAITDHDTLAGFDAARPLAEKHDVELLCSVEISTQFERPPERKVAVHLLGYFPESLPDEEFRSLLISISSARRQRNLKLMEMLHSLDIRISWQDFSSPTPASLPALNLPMSLL